MKNYRNLNGGSIRIIVVFLFLFSHTILYATPYKNSVFIYDNEEWSFWTSYSLNNTNIIHIEDHSFGMNLASIDVKYEPWYGNEYAEVLEHLVYFMITDVKVEHDGISEFVSVDDFIHKYDGDAYLSLFSGIFYDSKNDVIIKIYAPYVNEYMSKYVETMSVLEYLHYADYAEYTICHRYK